MTIIGVLLLALGACGGDGSPASEQGTAGEPPTAQTEAQVTEASPTVQRETQETKAPTADSQAPALISEVMSQILSEFGLSSDDLSDEEQSCLHELIEDELPVSGDSEEPERAFSLGMFDCIPDVFVNQMLSPFGVRMDELSDEEQACLRDVVSELYGEVSAAEDPEGGVETSVDYLSELSACVPDLELGLSFGSPDSPADSPPCMIGIVLEVGEGCMVKDFGVFYVNPDGWGVLESESSLRLTGNRLEDLDGKFVAEESEDGTWTIVSLP